MDRNYPGVPRIKAMLAAGTHVLIRVRDGITLRRTAGFLPDGSYLAEISGGGITLAVRVIEYTVTAACLTPPAVLPDHRPARPRCLPCAGTRAGLPLAVDRLGNLPERSQVRHHRGRAVHRADAALGVPGPGPPGARRRVTAVELAAPRPRRRGGRGPGPPGTPAPGSRRDPARSRSPRPGGPSSPPSGPARRQPACPPPSPRRTGTPSWPGGSGPPPRPGRPAPAPRSQDQGPAGLPGRRLRLATRTAPAQISVCQPLTA